MQAPRARPQSLPDDRGPGHRRFLAVPWPFKTPVATEEAVLVTLPAPRHHSSHLEGSASGRPAPCASPVKPAARSVVNPSALVNSGAARTRINDSVKAVEELNGHPYGGAQRKNEERMCQWF
jgi:hypothetical protein